MEKLTDDCLILLFHHLPLFDRLKSEQVSRKWRSIMPYNDIQTLNFWKDLHWPTTLAKVPQSQLQEVLFLVLSRCGTFLKEFIIGNPTRTHFQPETLHHIISLCPNLIKVDLAGAMFEGSCASLFLNAWPHLKHLSLSSASFVREEGGTYYHLPIPEEFRENFDTFMASHPDIETVDLTNFGFLHNPAPGDTFTPTFQNPGLKVLKLQDSRLTDANLADLSLGCPNLVSLTLDSCKSIHDFRPIANLVNLECLSAARTNIDNDDLAEICQHCQKISNLDVYACKSFTSHQPLGLLTNLHILNISYNPSFNDGSLQKIASHGKLQVLLAYGCHQLTSQSICSLGKLCHNMTKFDLGSTSVCDEGVLRVIESCKQLKTVNLSQTKVTNSFLCAVGSLAHSLETIDIVHCNNIDKIGFLELMEARKCRIGSEDLPQLVITIEKLHFDRCTGHFEVVLPNDLIETMKIFNIEIQFFGERTSVY